MTRKLDGRPLLAPQRRAPSLASASMLALAAGLLMAVPSAPAQQSAGKAAAGMLRFPAVSKTHICFSYANDLWLVPRDGGAASPLASPPGLEILPRFSPDGKTIAFIGNYDGNRDIYTVPVSGAAGGVYATRVTHHPAAESVCGWTPPDKDGKSQILFFTNGFQGIGRQTRLYTVAPEGGLPEPLPMPYAGFGSISETGTTVAFNLLSTDTRTWKRYRGGMAPDVWILDLATGTSKQITDWEGTDTQPMWHGRSIYYLSDNGPDGRLNIWAYDIDSAKRRQVTDFKTDEVRWPSMGPGPDGGGEIVFQLGAELMLLDLKTGRSKAVDVVVPGARATLRPRTVDAAKNIASYDLSPTGKRLVVEARGDIWTAPAKEGVVRNLTRTDHIAERSPVFSPDSKWIAYFSDVTGEYELYVRPADSRKPDKKDDAEAKPDAKPDDKPASDATAKSDDKPDAKAADAPVSLEPRKLTNLGPGFRFDPTWSPDSKWITFTDMAATLWLCDVEKGEVKQVDRDAWENRPQVSWSSDSGWIAYTRTDDQAEMGCVWLYNIKSGEKTRVTSPVFPSGTPAFDRAGDFLYIVSNRTISSPMYSDIDQSFIYAGTENILAVPLRASVKSPWATRSDEEELKKDEAKKEDKKEDKKPEGQPEGKPENKDEPTPEQPKKVEPGKDPAPDGKPDAKDPKKADKDKPKEVKIDLDGFERRAIIVPVPAGNFGGMAVNHEGKLIYVRGAVRGTPNAEPSIKILDPKDEKKEEKTVVAGAGGFAISADGKKLAARKDGKPMVFDAAPDGGKPTTVPTAGMAATVNPRDEWNQIFTDAWRFYRDWFYEPTLHGYDWKAIGDRYRDMIGDATTREDLNWILAELISELNVGHAYVTSAGDVEDPPNVSTGLLGCDFELDTSGPAPAFRIARIYEGGPWDADARGPLSQPGVNAKEGEYLLAVDGVPLDTAKDPWAAFVGRAGRPTYITLSTAATLDASAREVLITPLSSESELRYRHWIEQNRKYVSEKSGGRVGYLHVPDTGVNGQNNLFRQFMSQNRTDALIIDERWNGGGQIPTRFIELLNRPITNYWARRYAKESVWPPDAHHGPKAMMINGQAGSGGDAFPWYFRQAGIGKLVGRRTWGGLVGISGMPPFVDGGAVSVPQFAFYKQDGNWGVEGHGVDPDIDVVDDPGKMLTGGDPQLDAAITHLLDELKTKAVQHPKRPASPDRRGIGIPPEQR